MGLLVVNMAAGVLAQTESAAGGETIPLLAIITVFVLSVFLGLEVISKVPAALHTPLMSGTNAIHGIVLVGAMIVAGAFDTTLATILGFIAVIFAAGNVVGGFVVTDRMLQMFKKKPQPGGKR
jgi:H+-translocating NAD(P) transhydrogenase subunit alpha